MNYIYGYHEVGGQLPAGSWYCFTHELGHDPTHQGGYDYSPWSQYNVIARLNNGYFPHGTIPQREHYADFAQRVANWTRNSRGCHRWIIGNEPNHSQERPQGVPISPADYVECFNLCASQLEGEAIIAGVAPWNIETGDWIEYFRYVMENAQNVGGVCLHTYTHGSDPSLIASTEVMDRPYNDRYYHFLAYQDFVRWIPEHLPVYITESNQDQAWLNENNGWVQAAYAEVNRWNQESKPVIHCLCLYRWPNYDKWFIDGKQGVIADMQAAWEHGYHVGEEESMPENLIENPNFDPPYYEEGGVGEKKVATGWATWYDVGKQRPEWRQAFGWEESQQWFQTFDVGDGGVYQRVNVGHAAIGKWFQLRARVALESDGEHYASIGIDRLGETDYRRQTVTWTTPQHQSVVPAWTWLELMVQIEGEYVTVYLRGWNKYRINGSMFAAECVGYVVDDPCPPVEPPPDPEPPPVDGCVYVDPTPAILRAHSSGYIAMADKLREEADAIENPAGGFLSRVRRIFSR